MPDGTCYTRTDDLLLCPRLTRVETVSRCHQRPDAEHALTVLGNCYVVQHHAIEVVCVEDLWDSISACCLHFAKRMDGVHRH